MKSTELKKINLLPKTEQKNLRLQFFGDQLLFFWIFVIGSLFLFIGLTYIAKAYLTAQVAEVESKISLGKAELKSSDNELLKQKVDSLNGQISILKNLNNQHYYWSGALVELGNLLPPDITLTEVHMDRVGGKVSIKGVAGKRESVLQFWSNVYKAQYFKGIDFPLANLDAETNDPFSFDFYINTDKVKKP